MRWPRAGVLIVCAAAGLALTGCASVSRWMGREPVAAAAPERPAAPVYRLQVRAPSELKLLLNTYLDLARFQNAPESEDITPLEVDRLIAAAPAQVRALLETEGYFNPEVKVARVASANGEAAAGSEPAPATQPPGPASGAASGPAAGGMPNGTLPLIRIDVKPGPRTLVERYDFQAKGPLQESAAAGGLDAKVLIAQVRNTWPLQPEMPFRQSDWSSAKNSALARVRASGYPSATLSETLARVDTATNSVRLGVTADSGDRYRLGPMRIRGLSRYPESSVNALWDLKPGTYYRESDLVDFQERLQKAGLFEGASVALDVDPATSQAAPIDVRLRELPLQQATLGTGYSANTGPRVTLEHIHRQPFGWEWIAKNKSEVGPDLKSWSGELTSYPLPGLYRNLISGNAEELKTIDEVRKSWNLRLGRTQDTPRVERLVFAEVTHSRLVTQSDSGATIENNDAVSGNYHWIYRDLDSALLPTEGYTMSLQGALGFARSGVDNNGPFARTYGRYTLYRPVGNWYATARIEGGQVFANGNVGIPDTLLFRAGGDDSVRGYKYRSLGPTVDGALLSGRVLLTGSVELARPLSPRLPAVWGAGFIDAGQAADRWQNLHPVVGYGMGVRWRSPVGPLRLDLAYGHEVHQFRIHLSVGIAL